MNFTALNNGQAGQRKPMKRSRTGSNTFNKFQDNSRNQKQGYQHEQQQHAAEQEQLSDCPAAGAKPCALCKDLALLTCDRCDEYYCSEGCQRKDWAKHRYVCFRMPRLNKVQPLVNNNDTPKVSTVVENDISAQAQQNQSNDNASNSTENNSQSENLFPKNHSLVMLTGFRSPNRCFIRSLDPSHHKGYLQVFKLVNESGKISPKMQNLPKEGDLALTTYKPDGIFYRVKILTVRNASFIRVLFIDYGRSTNRSLYDLRQISEQVKNLPRYVFGIFLKDVPNYKFDEKINKFLELYENHECRVEYFEGINNKECILRSDSLKESINEELVAFASKQTQTTVYAKVQNADDKKDFNKLQPQMSQSRPSLEQQFEKVYISKSIEKIHQDSDEKTDQVVKKIDSSKVNDPPKPIGAANDPPKPIDKPNDPPKPIGTAANDPPKSFGTAANDPPKPIAKPNISSKPIDTKPQQSDEVAPVRPPMQIQKPVLTPPFSMVRFKNDAENFQVVSLDDSTIFYGYFGCVALTDIKNFQNVQDYLASYKDTERPYKPKMDEYCLAKFEGDWYRAKVIDVVDATNFTVVYIDYTNESTLTSDDIRRYPMDFTMSCYTNLCLIEGLPDEMDPKLVKYLKSRLGCQANIHKITKVCGFEENVALVQMDELIAELKAESLF